MHTLDRERIEALLDPGSAVEYGILKGRSDHGWVHTLGGVEFVGTIDGQAVVASSTDYSDHGGGYGAGQLNRLLALARENRWPIVLFADGGGSRAQVPELCRYQAKYPDQSKKAFQKSTIIRHQR